jgi:hypothetical protein
MVNVGDAHPIQIKSDPSAIPRIASPFIAARCWPRCRSAMIVETALVVMPASAMIRLPEAAGNPERNDAEQKKAHECQSHHLTSIFSS